MKVLQFGVLETNGLNKMARRRSAVCCFSLRYILICAIVLGIIGYIALINLQWDIPKFYQNGIYGDDAYYLINTEGCRIRKFHPFDPSVSQYFWEETSPLSKCHEESFFTVDVDKVYLNTGKIKNKFKEQHLNCTYQPIIRDPKNSSTRADFEISFGKPRPLQFGIALKHEFLKIECFVGNHSVIEDYLALVLLKPEVEKRCKDASKRFLGSEPLNVIIMAVDSTSKLNFMRHFPITNGFLQSTLKPFEFHGHTKVADNTFVNIVPMMTGHFVSHYRDEKNMSTTYYDDLDLVWKEFVSMGYRTLFIEDTPAFGTFTYLKRGFKKQGTDYYLRPFALAVDKTKWRTKKGFYCFGHTSETEFFYSYFREFIRRMGTRPYFAFSFISRPTHDYLNTAGYADRPTFNLLKDLADSNVLNKSVLIFFSDHGIRFGGIRKTFIGKVEERMPFMFQYYPEWFLKKYPHIREALTINQRRLTTPFDVHKTLQDVVVLSSKNGIIDYRKINAGNGQSLFQEISPRRTCEDAHIIPHWCVCHDHIQVDNKDKFAIEAAEKMMITINKWTNSVDNTSLCVVQSVKEIINVYVISNSIPEEQKWQAVKAQDYLVTIKVAPSNALFEGTIRYDQGKFSLVGEISRINSYGNQSWCIANHELKKYCFCNNL